MAFLCSPAAGFVTGAVLSVERRIGDVVTDRRRVVITGIGLVTSLGIGRKENWEAAIAGRSGAATIASFEPLDTRTTIACQVRGFEPADFMDKRVARRMDRFAQFAVAAGRMALEDAGLTIDASFAPAHRRAGGQRHRRPRDVRPAGQQRRGARAGPRSRRSSSRW